MEDLDRIYRKYKTQLLPLFLGFAAFFVIVRIVLPQWSDISDFKTQVDTKNASISTLKSNLQLLSSMPDSDVGTNYELATTALPVGKDVVLIFAELQGAAKKANVKLGGFSLKVGGIYSSSANGTTSISNTVSGVPFLNVSVSASGDNESLKNFANTLYKSIPLLEINSIDISGNNARYDVNLFYEPIIVGPTTQTNLKPLSSQDNALIKQLSDWGIPNSQ